MQGRDRLRRDGFQCAATMTDRKLIAGRITTRSWAAVTSLGFGLAFLSFIPGMLVMDIFLPPGLTNMGSSAMPEALDPEALPAWLDLETYRSWYRMHLGYHIAALAIFGGIVGCLQSRLLRQHVPALHWVVATAVGFVLVLSFETVERHVVVGPHGGPFEPLMISVGGSTIAGLAQWSVLRQRGVVASRWLAFWVVGVVVGAGVAIPAVIGLEAATQGLIDRAFDGVAAQAASWSRMLLTFGSVTGAVAGAISAPALRSSLAAEERGRAAGPGESRLVGELEGGVEPNRNAGLSMRKR
jgi:hypothetical protein